MLCRQKRKTEAYVEMKTQAITSCHKFITNRQGKAKTDALLMKNEHQSYLQEVVAIMGMLKTCASQKDLHEGSKIHHDILQRGFLPKNIYIGSTLVDMYTKCGALTKARQVFDELPFHNVVSWTTLIAGYAQHGQGEEALQCLQEMQQQHLSPNAVTFACILKACGSIGAVEQGKVIHGEIVKEGLLKYNVVLATALVDMYAKCGALVNAKEVFDELLDRNVISWTALMAGYAQHGKGEQVLFCFEQMQQEGHFPNALTISCILKACGSLQAAQKGKQLHAQIFTDDLMDKGNVLWTALVDMYAKCGALAKARQISDRLASRNVVSWTTLISRYCERGQVEEALNCFHLMQAEGLSLDIVICACVAKACGRIGAVAKGEKVHAEIVRGGLSGKMCALGGALVDMYSKCGALAEAKQAFNNLSYRSVVAWTALLKGHAQVGKPEKVFDLFAKMMEDGVKPNMITFLVVLNTCSLLNFVQQGQIYFEMMSTQYGIMPTSEHIVRMVGLFGHAGHFDKAMKIIEKIPSWNYCQGWLALLSACKKWDNLGLGRLAFEHIHQRQLTVCAR